MVGVSEVLYDLRELLDEVHGKRTLLVEEYLVEWLRNGEGMIRIGESYPLLLKLIILIEAEYRIGRPLTINIEGERQALALPDFPVDVKADECFDGWNYLLDEDVFNRLRSDAMRRLTAEAVNDLVGHTRT